MKLPPNVPIPLDSPPADPVEHRLRQAAPAPLNTALMARLRLARPDLDSSGETESASAAADASPFTAKPAAISTHSTPTLRASRRVIPFPGRGYWSAGAAAAALVLCGWAGWKAADPDAGTLAQSGGKTSRQGGAASAQNAAATPGAGQSGDSGNLEFLPALESRQHLLSVQDLGVFRDSHQRPVQLMSATWLDENTYGSSLDSELRESRVRHEIVPVVLPTY